MLTFKTERHKARTGLSLLAEAQYTLYDTETIKTVEIKEDINGQIKKKINKNLFHCCGNVCYVSSFVNVFPVSDNSFQQSMSDGGYHYYINYAWIVTL